VSVTDQDLDLSNPQTICAGMGPADGCEHTRGSPLCLNDSRTMAWVTTVKWAV